VPGDEHRVVAHGPKPLPDAADELGVVALGEIGAADAAGEQHVAHEGALRLHGMKHHMPRRVTRAVANVQRAVPDLHRIAVGQPPRGGEMPGGRKSEHLALLRQAVDPELVARVRADDGQAQALGQLGGAAGVVNMGVGEPDRLEGHTKLLGRVDEAVQLATRIDHGSVQRFVAPDDGAVLGKCGHGDGLVAKHGDVEKMWAKVGAIIPIEAAQKHESICLRQRHPQVAPLKDEKTAAVL